jgi:hypothetical protein
VTPKPGAVTRGSSRRGRHAAVRGWGPPGNERLTTSVSLVLLVLLVFEALTTLLLGTVLPVHIFVGLLLLSPIALKLASTGWRFMRYYTGNTAYRLKGPPRLLLRLLAPLLIASTLALFGSGVALIVFGKSGGLLLNLHAVSFAVWGGLIVVHVLAYLRHTLQAGTADWRRHGGLVVAGAGSRRAALGGALIVGAILATATYPAQQSWLSHRRDHRRGDGLKHAPAAAMRRIAP